MAPPSYVTNLVGASHSLVTGILRAWVTQVMKERSTRRNLGEEDMLYAESEEVISVVPMSGPERTHCIAE